MIPIKEGDLLLLGNLSSEQYEGYNPLSRQVYQTLRKAILEGDLIPGERLIERHLAEELNTSRTPIRVALSQLELEGLVVSTPRRGMMVAALSRKQIEEIYEIGAVLEGLAARQAAASISVARATSLAQLATLLEEAAALGKREWLQEAHLRFQEELMKSASSPRLIRMVLALREYVAKFTRIVYDQPERQREAVKEHREILECIIRGRAREAEEGMKRHIARSEEVLLRIWSEENSPENRTPMRLAR